VCQARQGGSHTNGRPRRGPRPPGGVNAVWSPVLAGRETRCGGPVVVVGRWWSRSEIQTRVGVRLALLAVGGRVVTGGSARPAVASPGAVWNLETDRNPESRSRRARPGPRRVVLAGRPSARARVSVRSADVLCSIE